MLCGKIVFTYSIANFPIMRCLEQIRNDVCYHNLNVKIVAVGGGLAYGAQGYTHHAVEDLAIMRALPSMTVVAPGDPVETQLATRAIVDWPGPCYLRLGKAGEPVVHESEPHFEVGKAIVVRGGSDVTLISTGGILKTIVDAADLLAAKGVRAKVVSMHTLAPMDEEAVKDIADTAGPIYVVEENGIGGLASAISEQLAAARAGVRSLNLAATNAMREVGSRSFLLQISGLSASHIADTIAQEEYKPT